MQTMNLQIEESFFPHFKALIDSFINDNKVKILKDEPLKDFECSSVEEVRRRVYLAEQQEGLSQLEYDNLMDKFFKEEIGIER